MATCSDIIARALRMARIVAIGDEAADSEQDEGMIALKSFYQRLADSRPKDEIYETADYEAEENERIYCTQTVTLPTTIIDNDSGEERRPTDLAVIQYLDENTSSAWRTYFSDRGTWTRTDSLIEGDTAPFADRDQEGLSAYIAVELAETFGREVSRDTRIKAMRFQARMWPRNATAVEYY